MDSIQPNRVPEYHAGIVGRLGFLGLVDLLKVARHRRNENIYLIRFHYDWAATPGTPGRIRRRAVWRILERSDPPTSTR